MKDGAIGENNFKDINDFQQIGQKDEYKSAQEEVTQWGRLTIKTLSIVKSVIEPRLS